MNKMVYTLEHDGKLRKDGQEIGKPKSIFDHKGPMYGGKIPLDRHELMHSYDAGMLTELRPQKTDELSLEKSEKENLIFEKWLNNNLNTTQQQSTRYIPVAHRHNIGDFE